MKKSKKHYRQRFNDFCSIAWLNINANAHRARALRKGMEDAIKYPLEDLTKNKKNEGISEDLSDQLEAETQKIKRQKPLKSENE